MALLVCSNFFAFVVVGTSGGPSLSVVLAVNRCVSFTPMYRSFHNCATRAETLKLRDDGAAKQGPRPLPRRAGREKSKPRQAVDIGLLGPGMVRENWRGLGEVGMYERYVISINCSLKLLWVSVRLSVVPLIFRSPVP